MILAIYLIFYGGIAFGLWLIYDFINWKYKDKIELWKMSKLADKMLYDMKKQEVVFDIQSLSKGLSSKMTEKRYETKEIPQIGASMDVREWTVRVKNKYAIDTDFIEIDNDLLESPK